MKNWIKVNDKDFPKGINDEHKSTNTISVVFC